MTAPVLTREQAAAFRLVAEGGGRFHPHAAAGLGDALWRLEALGLVQWVRREGWRLTPAGEARCPELGVWRETGR